MTSEALPLPRVIHELPGRVRLSLAGWTDTQLDEAETWLRRVRGARRVRASRWSNNVLVEFDPSRVDTAGIVRLLARLAGRTSSPAVSGPKSLAARALRAGIEAMITCAPRAGGPGPLIRVAIRAGAHVVAIEVAFALASAVLARADRRL